jgi:hypothetical protein
MADLFARRRFGQDGGQPSSAHDCYYRIDRIGFE